MKKLTIVVFLLGFFLFNSKLLAEDESYVRTEPVKVIHTQLKKIKHVEQAKKIKGNKIREVTPEEQKEIDRIFGSKAKIATAIFKHESELKIDAVNHNCTYAGKSTFCKKGDSNITSSDCGIGQINVKSKSCPANLLTSEGNFKAIERVYKAQGLNAWSSFKNKSYLAFMP